ncbi:hypothetical protein HWV62_22243 [Athelia sp. TMB]|nr:hypothetical protein HWV62_22243 [Athelia sp. TMB]
MHHLFHITKLKPELVETITPLRRGPNYEPPHSTHIAPDKDAALTIARLINDTAPVRVYVDGSGYKGGIGAAAVLYEGSRVIAVRRKYLGPKSRYTVHNGEAVGIIMGVHLLQAFTRRLIGPIIIGCDNQAVIRGLTNQKAHSGHYLLDHIIDLEEKLHAKQDGLRRAAERATTRRNGGDWIPRKKNVIDLQIHWVPGHKDFDPNERADREAKKAAKKNSSADEDLPACLRRKKLPFSVAALRQEHQDQLKRTWRKRWRKSPRCRRFGAVDNTAPSTKYLKLIDGLSRSQASLITQFRTANVPLNYLLFRIHRAESPACPHCGGITVETIRHYILDCPHYAHARHALRLKLGRTASEIPTLLHDKDAVIEFLRYVHATGRFK